MKDDSKTPDKSVATREKAKLATETTRKKSRAKDSDIKARYLKEYDLEDFKREMWLDLYEELNEDPEEANEELFQALYSELNDQKPQNPDKTVIRALREIIDQLTTSSKKSIILWSPKTNKILSEALREKGLEIKPEEIPGWLTRLGFDKVSNFKPQSKSRATKKKTFEDQKAFFSSNVQEALRKKQPVFTIETKKLIYKDNLLDSLNLALNPSQPYSSKDFSYINGDEELARGLYDIEAMAGLVALETDFDEASFALSTIKGWWLAEGHNIFQYPEALIIGVTGDMNNGYGADFWLTRLQDLANYLGARIQVSQGLTKDPWIEDIWPSQELFKFFSSNWRGQKKNFYQTTVRLISPPDQIPIEGPKNLVWLDHRLRFLGREVSRSETRSVNCKEMSFLGEVNYLILSQ
jgi:hypothetical protein